MKGLPKKLNTRADVEYVVNNFPKGQWQPKIQALLDARFGWYPIAELAEGEEGEFIAGEKTVIEHDDGTQVQYEKRVNPSAKMFRMGFTVEELETLLT